MNEPNGECPVAAEPKPTGPDADAIFANGEDPWPAPPKMCG